MRTNKNTYNKGQIALGGRIAAEKKHLICSAIFFVCFCLWTYLVINGFTQSLDDRMLQWVISIRDKGLTTLLETVTYIGNWETMAIVCILFVAFDTTRKTYGYPIMAIAIGSYFFNKLVKIMILRPRPDESLFLIKQGGYSFPSGHSATIMAVLLMILYLNHLYKNKEGKSPIYDLLYIIIILGVGFSRMYLGVHYFSDVIGGFIEGIAVFFFGLAILKVFGVIKKS